MIEDEKLTAREKRKLRREFSQLDRDSVRYNLQIGATAWHNAGNPRSRILNACFFKRRLQFNALSLKETDSVAESKLWKTR
jgi:hypothetical protein